MEINELVDDFDVVEPLKKRDSLSSSSDELKKIENICIKASGLIAKRKFNSELDDCIDVLRRWDNRFLDLDFRHKKIMLISSHISDVVTSYDEFIKSGNTEPIKVKPKKIRDFNLSEKTIDLFIHKIKEVETKSIIIQFDDFLNALNISDEQLPLFKDKTRGRFRIFVFKWKGNNYVELYDFFQHSSIKSRCNNGELFGCVLHGRFLK